MGIKFRCQSCDKKLHVKAFLAGKRGVCPFCGAKVRIPKESQPTRASESSDGGLDGSTMAAEHEGSQPETAVKQSSVAAAKSSTAKTATRPAASAPRPAADPITEAPDAVWYVRPPSGGQYGPADGDIMRRWLEEGRVGADSLVWREGWPDWKIAASAFPTLRQASSQLVETGTTKSPVESPEDPFAGIDKRPVDKRPVTRLGTTRSARRTMGRSVAIVVSLSVICVALLVALYLVLRNQG